MSNKSTQGQELLRNHGQQGMDFKWFIFIITLGFTNNEIISKHWHLQENLNLFLDKQKSLVIWFNKLFIAQTRELVAQ
jgi:hypothetical protein